MNLDPHQATLDAFISMLDTAIGYAAENHLPVYYAHTIFQFYAQRQMNILIAKAEDSDYAATQSQEVRDPFIVSAKDFDGIRESRTSEGHILHESATEFLKSHGHNPGIPIAGTAAYSGYTHHNNELAREFASGNCTNCIHGGPAKCPLSCPAKDFCDNPAPDCTSS